MLPQPIIFPFKEYETGGELCHLVGWVVADPVLMWIGDVWPWGCSVECWCVFRVVQLFTYGETCFENIMLRFCLVVEQVQIKLTKSGQTNWQPKLADIRLMNKKTCRTGFT